MTDLVGYTLLDARVDVVHSRVDLYHSQSQRGAHPEQGGYHGQDIDHISGPTVDLISDQGVEARLHRHRHPLPECYEAEEESYHYVYYPPMNACGGVNIIFR